MAKLQQVHCPACGRRFTDLGGERPVARDSCRRCGAHIHVEIHDSRAIVTSVPQEELSAARRKL